MKLSDFNVNKFLKVLAFGKSGTGKTCFAAGFPTPMLILDFDGKANSAAAFFKNDPERLSGITVESLPPKDDGSSEARFMEIIEMLSAQQRAGKLEYATIVVDSLTTMSSMLLRHIVKTNPGIKRPVSKQGLQPCMQDYGILKREFARLIPGLISLEANVVMLGHISITKDENTGEIIRGVALDGSFGQELPIYFEEVYHTYVKDGKYMAQTQADFRFMCRTQRGLPKEIELNYNNLLL